MNQTLKLLLGLLLILLFTPAVMAQQPAGVEDPIITVDPITINSQQVANVVVDHTLTIKNIGGATLEWEIDEAEAEARAGGILYDNGPFVTHPVAGPGGSDHSTTQNLSLGMTLLGTNVSLSEGYRVADQFTVTAGEEWEIDGITFYSYQTGSSTTSSFNHVNYRIWDGVPGDPSSSIVFGNTTTNRLVSTDWTNAYRISESTADTTRPVMYIEASAGFTLSEGTYWIDWQLGGTLFSGPWQLPITIIGQSTTGDALRYLPDIDSWQAINDSGTGTAQGVPFVVNGTASVPVVPCTVPSDITWLSVSPATGSTAANDSSEVTVSIDSTGLEVGIYEALLCVHSNDPINPVVIVPVSVTVNPYTYGVDLTPATDAQSGTPGTDVTYTLTLTNTGDGDDTFTIAAEGNSWEAVFPTTIALSAGASTTIDIIVNVPGIAIEGDVDAVTITATSDTDTIVEASSELTTTAAIIEWIIFLPTVLAP